MKIQFSKYFDYNQMLVYSVFGHLLILTFVLFLPKPALQENPVVPAFMVNLVAAPQGLKPAAAKRPEGPARLKKPKARKRVEKKTLAKKTLAKKKPVRKKTVSKSDKILQELNRLEGRMALVAPQGKKMVDELDQLTRLEKQKVKPAPVKPLKKKSVSEKTFRELEKLKNKKINELKAVTTAPLEEEILKDFEELKMEDSLPETLQIDFSPDKKQKHVKEKQKPEKPKVVEVDLLKELEQLAKLDMSPVLTPDTKSREPGPVDDVDNSREFYDSIIEKFDSLSVESEPVKVEVSTAWLDPERFHSNLRSLPKIPPLTVELGAEDSYVLTKKEGTPGADLQTLYVGLIQEKIYKNWREPLAEEHNQEAVVSFYIFPKGNIDKPFIKKSSGVGDLDNLAVRAVLDSAPFPEFPKELKLSNLHINIHFKYVPKD